MKQLRDTPQRRLVLETVRARHDHPTADEIYLDARARDGRISRGTVYRNLSILSDSGEILHVKVPVADRFDSRVELHCHLLCTGCGAVTDAPLPYRAAEDREMAAATGYRITRHRTVFEGLCPDCAARERNGGTASQ
jgi:Fe2+ or Zn2+ uptake regulation protein